MTDEQIKKMVLDIVIKVDYDIFKLDYVKETADYPEEVEDNIAALVKIVRRHLPYSTDE